MTYDFEVVYKKRKENRATDALLRISSQKLSCMALSSISHVLYQQVLSSYEKEKGIQKVLQDLQQDPQSHKNFTNNQRQLRKSGRMVDGNDEAIQKCILELFHTLGFGVILVYMLPIR